MNSTDETDGFLDSVDNEVERQNGQPLIVQPDGSRLAYTRASSLGGYLAETEYLRKWELRYLARQMGKNEDLAALAAQESYSTGFDENAVTKSASGRKLDGIIARAFDRGRMDERADYGTVVHHLTEPGNEGYEPVRAAADVQAFWEHIEDNGIKIAATEVFVVQDELKVAGTFDHLVWTERYGWTIADKKTGRNINGLGFCCQFAPYSRGKVYDPVTGERTELTQFTGGEPINLEWALLFEVHDGMCRTRRVPIDDERGWKAAKLAAEVRDARRWNALANIDKGFKTTKGPELTQRAIIRRINESRFPEELLAIWYQWKGSWSDEITAAAKAKKEAEGWT